MDGIAVDTKINEAPIGQAQYRLKGAGPDPLKFALPVVPPDILGIDCPWKIGLGALRVALARVIAFEIKPARSGVGIVRFDLNLGAGFRLDRVSNRADFCLRFVAADVATRQVSLPKAGGAGEFSVAADGESGGFFYTLAVQKNTVIDFNATRLNDGNVVL